MVAVVTDVVSEVGSAVAVVGQYDTQAIAESTGPANSEVENVIITGKRNSERFRIVFDFVGRLGNTQGSNALYDFTTSDAPIRWWQVTMPVDWGGVSALPSLDSGPLDIENPLAGIPKVTGMESRLTRGTRDRLMTSIVIVDINRVGSAAPPVLSDWDKAYLGAVYGLDRTLVPRSQAGALTNKVLDNFYK